MNVLDAAERLLPELELDSRLELRKACVKVARESINVGKVDGVRLVRVLLRIGEVLAELLAQPAELGLAVVDAAKLERLERDVLVDDLEARVALGDLETALVGLPAEAHPGGDEGALDALAVGRGHGAALALRVGDQVAVRGGLVEQRVDKQRVRLERELEVVLLGTSARDRIALLGLALDLAVTKHFLGLGLSSRELLLGALDERENDLLERRDRHLLRSKLVLPETLTREPVLAERRAELEELEDDRLEDRQGSLLEPFTVEAVGSDVKLSWLGLEHARLEHFHQALKTLLLGLRRAERKQLLRAL